jgi:hypothetical protein
MNIDKRGERKIQKLSYMCVISVLSACSDQKTAVSIEYGGFYVQFGFVYR